MSAKPPIESCKRGHPFNEDNTNFKTQTKNGKEYSRRDCRACRRARARLYKRGVETNSPEAREALICEPAKPPGRPATAACKRGHVYTEGNTTVRYEQREAKRNLVRICRACVALRTKARTRGMSVINNEHERFLLALPYRPRNG